MNIGIYFNQEEREFITTQPKGYVRSLVRKEMSRDVAIPTEVKPRDVAIKPEAPKDKVFFVKETEIKMTCKVCKGLLDTRNHCSNKKCKQFMK